MRRETQDVRQKPPGIDRKEDIIEMVRNKVWQGEADIQSIESLVHKRGVQRTVNFYKAILYYLENDK